ncbi:hypothetical protein PFTANZ_06603, partial [Plasmodium falciparum Tanzania (2000708)]
FYKKFKIKYPKFHDFLSSLNEEANCKNLRSEKESEIDFNKDSTTFSGSQYCKPCPICGVECDSNKCTHRDINHPKCQKANKYTPTRGAKETDIKVLSSGEKREDITKKLKDFCDTSDSSKLTEEWKCYYEKQNNEACILKNKNKSADQPKEIQKTFYDFFYYWVAHVLKDSESWRTELSKCLKYNKKQCMNKCKRNCKCYEQWVELKKKEWEKIKEHYEKQDGLPSGGITNAYGDPSETERIKKMLEKKNTEEKDDDTTHRSTIIDELLKHELEDAKKCVLNNPKDDCPEEDSDSDDEVEEEDELPSAPNPCSGDPSGSSTTHRSMVKTVAREMHRKAHQEAKGRIGGHISKLKGDISKGKFRNGVKGSKLKTVCEITKDYSNRNTRESDGPCYGKNKERFEIGKEWSYWDETNKKKHPQAYMPQRREHMCTSNLQYLETNDGPLKGNGNDEKLVNHSFLGDVLLSANFEAKNIKD